MKKKYLFLTLLIVALVMFSSIGSALAYFSTYTTASGGYPVIIDNNPTIKEKYKSGQKFVTISNVGDGPIFVRAKAIATAGVTLTYSEEEGSNLWTNNNLSNSTSGADYYYYTKTLEGKTEQTVDSTSQLIVTITFPSTPSNGAQSFKEGDEVNVVVLFESVPAIFLENGEPDFATAWTVGPVTIIE